MAPHAIVIGASSSIGIDVSSRLLKDGWRVTATFRTQQTALRSIEHDALIVRELDVSIRERVRALVEEVSELFGPPTAMVYCAGQVIDRPFMLMTAEDWSRVIDVNLTGAFHAAQAVARGMMVENTGKIVFIGSSSSQIGNPGQANYAASKAALAGLCRTLAVELAPYGIAANVVAAGPVETAMTRELPMQAIERIRKRMPGRRIGQPGDIGEVVRFLLSSECRFLTGQVISVDGGLTVS